jgi:hypothetical protein
VAEGELKQLKTFVPKLKNRSFLMTDIVLECHLGKSDWQMRATTNSYVCFVME